MYSAITILLPTAISHQSSHSPLTPSPLSDPPDDPRICGVPTGKHMCTAVYTALFVIGGYGASLWAIMLIVAADFTAEMGRPPTRTEENISCVVVHVLMLVQVYHICAGAYISSDDPHEFVDQVLIYDMVRLALIFLSAAAVARMYYVLCKMAPKGQRRRSPLYHLLRKLVYYPLVQCLCRASITPYDFGYRSTVSSFPPNAGALQVCASGFVGSCEACVCVCATGPVRRACVCARNVEQFLARLIWDLTLLPSRPHTLPDNTDVCRGHLHAHSRPGRSVSFSLRTKGSAFAAAQTVQAGLRTGPGGC